MKTVLNLLVQILLAVGLLACLQCTPQKDKDASKEIAEAHNDDKLEEKNFEEKWCREVMNRREKMIKDFETYAAHGSGNLKIEIDEALPTLRAQQNKLMVYQESVEE